MNLDLGRFYFNGKNSSDFGMYVKDVFQFIPPKRPRKLIVPKRDGAYDFGADNYDEVGVSLECYCEREYNRSSFREVTYWLSKKSRLYIWDDPDKYNIAELYNGDDLSWENISHMNPFVLEFVCEPFAYKDVPAVAIGEGENRLQYNGTRRAPVIITIRNPNPFPISNINITLLSREENI